MENTEIASDDVTSAKRFMRSALAKLPIPASRVIAGSRVEIGKDKRA